MSFEAPLPPPPPSPLPGQQQHSPLRRLAVQPPIITTALAPPQAQGASGGQFLHGHQTPASATSLSLPFSPGYAASASPSTYAPSPAASSPMRPSVPYNPQQWGRSGPVSAHYYVPHSTSAPGNASTTAAMSTAPAAMTATATATATPTSASTTPTGRPRHVTGMEASMPSPPPPYSPAHNHHMPQSLGSPEYVPSPPSRPVSSYVASRPSSVVVPSSATSITSNPQFPPPPPRNGKERSISRDKSHSKFSLSSFRNRNSDHSPAPTAIESLRLNTSEAIQRAPASPGLGHRFLPGAFQDRQWSPESQSPVRPPASRRAASAGVLGHATETRTPTDASPSPLPAHGSWGQGMPLPPPPPGPPPSSSRSQSLGRGLDANAGRHSALLPAPPTRRPGQSSLATIPPTPIGWQDGPSADRTSSPAAQGLQIDTNLQAMRTQDRPGATAPEAEDVSVSSGPTSTSHSSSTLYRTPPRSDQSSQGIRERRSESRAAKERAEPSNNPWAHDLEAASAKPANLDLGASNGSLTRRGATKGTPRSAGAIKSPRSSHFPDDPGSSHSTPRIDSYRRVASSSAPTPPFSPGTDHFDSPPTQKAPPSIPYRALPTPPLHHQGDDSEPVLTRSSATAHRSSSRASHLSESGHEGSSSSTPRPTDRDSFAQAAMERHRQFMEKEMEAESDQDRLELFAEFIVVESRIRRDRYSGAFDAMAGDIMDLTRDLWRSYVPSGRRSTTPSAHGTSVAPSGRRSQASTAGESPDTRITAASPASSVTNFTPHTEPASPSSATSQRPRDASWNNNYQPCLSPIPSMAMSTVPDEEDSRGRSASRWWEASDDGGSSGIGSRRVERSKRESKYMGLPKEARESLQWAGESDSPSYRSGSSNRQTYGPNDYPAEKAGLHEDATQVQPAQSHGYYPSSAPATPDPHKLDVSRLVTLPPPYPRHHPAVNNNHPDLAPIRTSLRNLSDLQEVKTTKERFNTTTASRKEQENKSLVDRRSQLRYNIQENLRSGVMAYADAAKAEGDFEAREQKRAQEVVQGIFDSFQTEVANPLHAMFCERITKVSASIEHLKGRLSHDAQELNPNQTQEEGDEQPELLEMLTLLKWLFETREQLHKEMFELEDERNDLYKDIIVLPYAQTKNDQKVKEATEFFRRDAQDRKVTFEKEMLKRYEIFMNAIEENVTRGVEAQLSAFWDIAPGLLAIVQKVPPRLDGFEILIPPNEYDENPVYHDFPMQYLYSLLAHAGRSAYQFMESQINLLCLLHEVKTGVMTAGSRLLETQRIIEGEDLGRVDQEMRAIREDEERRLTDDLKEKVGLVESQWGDALGNGLEDCKARVAAFLVQQGGWDDSLQE